MKIIIWTAQVLLALSFAMSGFMKAFSPVEDLALVMPWVAVVPVWLLRFIGVAELAGAIGLVLPSATRIKPGLTPLAAVLLGVVMVLAAGFHLLRGEYIDIVRNLVLLVVAVFVAYGRRRVAPIQPRS